jgi:DNA-binding NarL/FixJ family response regulator
MTQTVAIVVSDLLFQSRIDAAARALGLAPRIADSAEALADALAARPAVVVIDLHERACDPTAAITDAKAAGARVLAFGRHTEPATLRAARDAGADLVVPRSQIAEELPELLRSLMAAQEIDRR